MRHCCACKDRARSRTQTSSSTARVNPASTKRYATLSPIFLGPFLEIRLSSAPACVTPGEPSNAPKPHCGAAEEAAETLDIQLLALLTEAQTVGLADANQSIDRSDRAALIAALQAARHAPEPVTPDLPDAAEQDRRRELERSRDEQRRQLLRLLDERALLLDQQADESSYFNAVTLQAGRLAILGSSARAGASEGETESRQRR